MSDPAALVPVLGAFGLVAVVAFIWTENRTHYPRPIQVGRPHARVRRRWPPTSTSGPTISSTVSSAGRTSRR